MFRDHGDNTLAEILPALEMKRRFMSLLGHDQLRNVDEIERFLADVRERVRGRRLAAVAR
jgi:hypothetical protein